MPVKLKRKDITPLKKRILLKQQGLCALSRRRILPSASVLDHDHYTGYVRAVLSRGTNGAEGKIDNLLTRWCGCKSRADKVKFLRRLADYWELHSKPQTEYIHPDGKKKETK